MHTEPSRSEAAGTEAGVSESEHHTASTIAGHDGKTVWLYDGVCGFCSWSVRFLLAHEREPSTIFIAIQSDVGRQLAIRHGVDPDDPSTFLLIEHGAALAKSDGVIALARNLRWPWAALAWMRVVPRSWRDRPYDLLARNRYRIFGRHERCEIPAAAVRQRFIVPT